MKDDGIRRPSAAGRTDTSPDRRKKDTPLRVVRHDLRLSGSTHRERVEALSVAIGEARDDPVRRQAIFDAYLIASRYHEEQER